MLNKKQAWKEAERRGFLENDWFWCIEANLYCPNEKCKLDIITTVSGQSGYEKRAGTKVNAMENLHHSGEGKFCAECGTKLKLEVPHKITKYMCYKEVN